MKESMKNPIFLRKDTLKHFHWRIRNLNYEADNFEVSVDKDGKNVVIRTKNKKYYKKFTIEDIVDEGKTIDENLLEVSFANSTLVIEVGN